MEDALEDVLAWLAEPSTADATRFTPAILAEVSIEEIQAGLGTLGGGEWIVTDLQPLTDTAVVATVQGPNQSLNLQLELDASGLIDTLFFENAGLAEPPQSLDELTTRLEAAGEVTGFLAAEIDAEGTCAAVAQLRPDEVLPIASAFKLYVLGAVADAVAVGELAWDQPVTIRDELDSPGVGPTQDAPDGSAVTLQELALRMISVSDNTATDHLIDLVGREAVEGALVELGHADPDVTRPLLTTREMAVLKVDTDLLARYEAADADERRQLLAEEVASAPTPALDQQWSEPRAVTTVEWFASPLDLCRALVALDERSQQPGLEPLTEILATNPGMVLDPAQYPAVLFKGGSEPGVLVGAWLGRRADGTRVVVTGGAASTTEPIDPSVIELVGSALVLV
jgi:beta-lactamase class A